VFFGRQVLQTRKGLSPLGGGVARESVWRDIEGESSEVETDRLGAEAPKMSWGSQKKRNGGAGR